uniref:TATA-box binding protein associated factor 3 n=1 Tax=Pipistrellus kuhlii TaxID=59472 RepID=A0A7J8B639_PIPKU|nr:TATA-box binding protein associated factor 3 [Pipistrellus kuhlii]
MYSNFLNLEVKMQRKEKNTFLITCHPLCLLKKKKKKSRCPLMGGHQQKLCKFPWKKTMNLRRRKLLMMRISWARDH